MYVVYPGQLHFENQALSSLIYSHNYADVGFWNNFSYYLLSCLLWMQQEVLLYFRIQDGIASSFNTCWRMEKPFDTAELSWMNEEVGKSSSNAVWPSLNIKCDKKRSLEWKENLINSLELCNKFLAKSDTSAGQLLPRNPCACVCVLCLYVIVSVRCAMFVVVTWYKNIVPTFFDQRFFKAQTSRHANFCAHFQGEFLNDR